MAILGGGVQLPARAAVRVGDNTTDRVECGADPRLSGLSQFTVFGWWNPSVLTDGRFLLLKRNSSSNAWAGSINLTSGNIGFQVNGTNGPASQFANTVDTPLAILERWYFIAYVCDFGVSQAVYVGTLTDPAVERTLGGTTALGTSIGAGSDGNLILGNRGNSDRPFQGRIGEVGVATRVLSLQEVRALQAEDYRQLGVQCVYACGANGRGPVLDSFGQGPVGVQTGTYPVAGRPLRRWWRGAEWLATPPPNDTTLAAAVTCSVTAAGALSTGITMAGSATLAVSSAGALSTDIRMAGAGQLEVAASGALGTSIEMAATSAVSVVAAADLSTAIQLEGLASLSLTTAGALGTSITMAGGANLAVAAAGALTAEITLGGQASLAMTTTGDLATAITMAGAVTISIAAVGAVATDIQLAGVSALAITTTGALDAPSTLAASATCSISASGALLTAIQLSGQAALSLTMTGGLATAVRLAGTASCAVGVVGALAAEIQMAGASALAITSSGALATGSSLAGAVVCEILAVGALQVGAPFSRWRLRDTSVPAFHLQDVSVPAFAWADSSVPAFRLRGAS